MNKKTRADIEAEELFKNFDIEIPINPDKICTLLSSNSLRIEYHEREIETPNICGMSITDNNSAHIIVNSKIKSSSRRLFTAAHELGHVILHIQTGKKAKSECSNNDIFLNKDEENMEAEANQFASALIMPQSLIVNAIYSNELTWQLMKTLSQKYHSSLEATARRAVKITKDMYALIIHEKSKMWSPVTSNSFPCFIPTSNFSRYLQPIIFGESDFNFPNRLEECELSDWNLTLNPHQYRCYYSSLNFAKYSRIMTLLSIEEIETEDDPPLWEEPHF